LAIHGIISRSFLPNNPQIPAFWIELMFQFAQSVAKIAAAAFFEKFRVSFYMTEV
jgi:hypothetical protein